MGSRKSNYKNPSSLTDQLNFIENDFHWMYMNMKHIYYEQNQLTSFLITVLKICQLEYLEFAWVFCFTTSVGTLTIQEAYNDI